VQPKDGAKTVICEVIVASTCILMNFEEQVRAVQKVSKFFIDRIADYGQPGIQVV